MTTKSRSKSDTDRLIECARKGDKKALPALREWMDTAPKYTDQLGDLAAQVEISWLNTMLDDNLLVKEAVERKIKSMKVDLGGANPSFLERLLIDRIVACWLQVHYADMIYAQNIKALDRNWNELYQRRQQRAQARYLSAIKTLAIVRRLNTPALQVNIGQKQVNVAGSTNGAPNVDAVGSDF